MVGNNDNKLAGDEDVEPLEDEESNDSEEPRCHQEQAADNQGSQDEQQQQRPEPQPHQPQPQPQPHHHHPPPHHIRLHFHCNSHQHHHNHNPAQQNPQQAQVNQGGHHHPNQPQQHHRHINPHLNHHYNHHRGHAHIHMRAVRPIYQAQSNPPDGAGAVHNNHLPMNNDSANNQPIVNGEELQPVVGDEEANQPPAANGDNQQPPALRNANPNHHEGRCPHHHPEANDDDNDHQQHPPNVNPNQHEGRCPHHHPAGNNGNGNGNDHDHGQHQPNGNNHLANGNQHHNQVGNGPHHHHHGIAHIHHNGHGNHHQHHRHHHPIGNHPLLHHHYNNAENQQLPELRSRMSHNKSFLKIKNSTKRQVSVIWINYRGNEVLYRMLNPGETLLNIDTYVTHPWIFVDKKTKCRLIADYLGENHTVLMPRPWFLNMPRSNLFGQVTPRRITVNIKLPLYSLKERAEQIVRQNLRDPKDASELEIPKILVERLSRTE